MSPRVGGQTVMPEFGALRLDLLENRAADEELFHQLATSSEQKAEMLQQMTRGGAGPRAETAGGKHAELVVEMRQKASVRRPPSVGHRRLLPGSLVAKRQLTDSTAVLCSQRYKQHMAGGENSFVCHEPSQRPTMW